MSMNMTARRTAAPVHSEFSNDPDFEEILHLFVESIPEKQKNFREYYLQGEWNSLKAQAHQLKGSGGGYGFDDLTVEASNLERACQSQDIDQIGQALNSLLNYMGRITV
ncbi:MAG: Hpt domain-containing protein [Planctomycetaceae bacterium]